MLVNGKEYSIICLLGHGKGGYSYLSEYNGQQFTLKKIHHEPCSYYNFGNKIESELNDYQTLKNLGLRIPKMIEVDVENEIIIKEYIEGKTILDLVLEDANISEYVQQVRDMASLLRKNNLNIDYFPTNFIVNQGVIFYIDYECNKYMDEYSFENWGIKYWYKSIELEQYLKSKE